MSSLIAVSSSEGESILPEVEELSAFHPDQLSSLVDIQEELEKLEASDNVCVEEVMSMSTVDDVNVVDHEVTIVADHEGDMAILPEISELNTQSHEFYEKISHENSYNSIIEDNLDIGETITIGTPVSESGIVDRCNSQSQNDLHKFNSLPIKPAGPIMGQSPVNVSHLKTIRPLPDGLKEKKPLMPMVQSKKSMLTKVIFTPNSQAAPDASPLIFGESGGQTIRIVGQNKAILTNSPKTITLAQAREMGLLSPGKMQHFIPSHSKGMVKKGVMMGTNKTVTMVKSSPTKILPLPTSQLQHIAPSPTISTLTAGAPQKIFFRQSPSTMKSATFSGTILAGGSAGSQGQILQIPVSQDNANNQIHQIQLPGKQVQYVRLVNSVNTTFTTMSTSGSIETLTKSEQSTHNPRPVPVALSTNVSQLKMIAPVHTLSGADQQTTNSFERVLVSPGLSQLAARPTDAKPPTSNIVMVPAEYVKQYKPLSPQTLPVTQSPPSPPKPPVSVATTVLTPLPPPLLTKAKEVLTNKEAITAPSSQKSKPSSEPPNGIRPRKPCNCTKSQCLKLYCDCFANGEFCFQCNCNCCFNNLDHEEERQRAIKACLERNPNAFRPKIGKGYIGDERRHNKGCNCKRSGCLKNYCECYEAKIPCSNNCKCIGCRNVEDIKDIRDRGGSEGGNKVNQQVTTFKNKVSSVEIQECSFKPNAFLTNQSTRQPFHAMSQGVVEATCQCLLAQVGDKQLTEQVERRILEEFGRCLVAIIDHATRTPVNSAT